MRGAVLSEGDREFLAKVALPHYGIAAVVVKDDPSTAVWPDISVDPSKDPPVIEVTREWQRQSARERRKRLVHELEHIDGREHDESIGYSTYPDKDTFSMMVYRDIMKGEHAR